MSPPSYDTFILIQPGKKTMFISDTSPLVAGFLGGRTMWSLYTFLTILHGAFSLWQYIIHIFKSVKPSSFLLSKSFTVPFMFRNCQKLRSMQRRQRKVQLPCEFLWKNMHGAWWWVFLIKANNNNTKKVNYVFVCPSFLEVYK